MLNLVAGGAGFLGSHLVNALVDDGDDVLILDNLSSGHIRNMEHAICSGRATFAFADVATPPERFREVVRNATKSRIDRVYHFASPANLQAYDADRWGTLTSGAFGCISLIELALHYGARFLLASTSGIYGDPFAHPQPETYFGNVDPAGPRSAYDEGKRFGEAAVAAARARGLDGRIVRFFNCYGPGMTERDGRLIPALIDAVRSGRPFPIHGTGNQTRSMTYVSDAVRLARLVMETGRPPLSAVNIGSDEERSVEEIARTLARIANVEYAAVHVAAREQDPQRRRPDLTRAKSLGWSPEITLEDGLLATYRWFCEERLAFA